jgi:hypothetical protein
MNNPIDVGPDGEKAVAHQPLGAGSWSIILVLAALLVATGFVGYIGWMLGSGAEVSASGYVSMALRVVLSLAVGFGLMALVFYSSRRGFDEPPVFINTETETHSDPSVDKVGESK